MDSPRTHSQPGSVTTTTRRSSSDCNCNSPEFEFWMVRNPSFPQPNLLSADELFVDGVLLPLHLLSHHPPDPNAPHHPPDPAPSSKTEPDPEPEAGPRPESSLVTAEPVSGLSSSKRWTDIFKKGDKKTSTVKIKEEKEKEKEKKREKKSQTGSGSSAAAELNINIWPFSRSRSAGNGGTRPRLATGAPTRKVSSAPCSRSNSAGESKSRKWPSSPGRPGVHVGRSSPIWQVRRGGGGGGGGEKGIGKREATETRGGKSGNKSAGGGNGNGTTGAGKVRALNLNVNVPMCIGYRHHLGCRSDENSTLGVVGVAGSGKHGTGNGSSSGGVTSSGNLFNIRSLFTKKVY